MLKRIPFPSWNSLNTTRNKSKKNKDSFTCSKKDSTDLTNCLPTMKSSPKDKFKSSQTMKAFLPKLETPQSMPLMLLKPKMNTKLKSNSILSELISENSLMISPEPMPKLACKLSPYLQFKMPSPMEICMKWNNSLILLSMKPVKNKKSLFLILISLNKLELLEELLENHYMARQNLRY